MDLISGISDGYKIIGISHLKIEGNILNYFERRSTNASAGSFNAKIKNFRLQLRGVRDRTFFLFRLSKLLLSPQILRMILCTHDRDRTCTP
ncbi:transposase [Chryseobacterium caseinilyticum]